MVSAIVWENVTCLCNSQELGNVGRQSRVCRRTLERHPEVCYSSRNLLALGKTSPLHKFWPSMIASGCQGQKRAFLWQLFIPAPYKLGFPRERLYYSPLHPWPSSTLLVTLQSLSSCLLSWTQSSPNHAGGKINIYSEKLHPSYPAFWWSQTDRLSALCLYWLLFLIPFSSFLNFFLLLLPLQNF